jgi:hypothetical protein
MSSAQQMNDLRGGRAPGEMRFGAGGKIIAALAVLLAVGALVGYGFETGQFNVAPKPVVSDSQLPTTGR